MPPLEADSHVIFARVPADVHARIVELAALDERSVTSFLTRLVRSLGDDGQTSPSERRKVAK